MSGELKFENIEIGMTLGVHSWYSSCHGLNTDLDVLL